MTKSVSYFVGIIEKGKMPEVYMGEVRMLTEGWRRRHTYYSNSTINYYKKCLYVTYLFMCYLDLYFPGVST